VAARVASSSGVEVAQQAANVSPSPGEEGRGEGGPSTDIIPKPGQLGVFWQTQGSGKSFSMVFFAQKVLRKVAGNWTFVVVTDRVELDDQIAKTFKATGAVSEAEGDQCHAASGAHLRELLRGNHRTSSRATPSGTRACMPRQCDARVWLMTNHGTTQL
jgi:hypothetical protein